MAKKRKTRQQKISTTLRNSENPVTYTLSSFEKPLLDTLVPINTPVRPHTQDISYQFVRHDLLKTITITGAIILTELALFLILR